MVWNAFFTEEGYSPARRSIDPFARVGLSIPIIRILNPMRSIAPPNLSEQVTGTASELLTTGCAARDS